jgi:hypothetical protein
MNVKRQTKQLLKLTREDKALKLFQAGAVSRVKDDMYHVKSPEKSKHRIRSNSIKECLYMH